MRLVLIVEARADAISAGQLADWVLIACGPDWVTEDAIEDLRRWTGLEADMPFTTWHDLKKQHAYHASCDYIPKRSYPLLQAREVLRLLAEEGIEGGVKEFEQRGDGV